MSRKTRTYNRDVYANMRGVTSSHWGKTAASLTALGEGDRGPSVSVTRS
jgi:hypothetical protein